MTKRKLETGDELIERLTKLMKSKNRLATLTPEVDDDKGQVDDNTEGQDDYQDDIDDRTSDLLWTINHERKH
jgi:hypothetical protein